MWAISICFDAAAAVAAVHQTLGQRGVEFTRPPDKMAWGGTLADFRDPGDNVLTLVQLPAA